MLERVLDWSLRHRLLVVLGWGVVAALGLVSLTRLPLDAFPDTSPVQVHINTIVPALGPEEIEQRVTIPVESAISGLPGLIEVRSLSRFGLSQITAVFADGTDPLRARQLVAERLGSIELPPDTPRPELGPLTTGLGEIFHYAVRATGNPPLSLAALTAIHDRLIRPQLRAVPGVAEVNGWGGQRRQLHIAVDPLRLAAHGVTLEEVAATVRLANAAAGGGYISESGEAKIVHALAHTPDPEHLAQMVIAWHNGVPVRVGDVATVREGHALRRGAVTADGAGEIVLGLGFMVAGENPREVARRLDERLADLRRSLPPGVAVEILLDRRQLVDRVIATVRANLQYGALLVVAVLFAMLGSLRAGLIVALAIPLAMLVSFSAMLQIGIAASLLSLGAIDFGLVVDGAVIVVENAVRRLHDARRTGPPRPLADIVREAALEVRRPSIFGEAIIMIVYLPILLLEGVEGKLFRPMALTVVLALAGAMVFSITLAPVLCTLFPPPPRPHTDNALVRALQRVYRPALRLALRWPRTVLACGAGLLAWGAYLATGLGTAFIPRLYEDALAINTVRLAAVSLEESVAYGLRIERYLLEKFPDEIARIWTRTGTADVATDPMGFEVSDMFLVLTDRTRWRRARTQAELVDRLADELAHLPGMRAVISQPIEMRVNEMTAGLRADLGVKIFGDDLGELRRLADQARRVLEAIPGSTDVLVEQITGQTVIRIRPDPEALTLYEVSPASVLQVARAVAGLPAGEIRQGPWRTDVVVRLDDQSLRNAETLHALPLAGPSGQLVSLGRVARIDEEEGPSAITREWGQRRIVVQANVRGRDLGSFVSEARRRLLDDLPLLPGYRLEFGGQYQHLQQAARRLWIVIPTAVGLILVLLYLATGSVRDSLIVLTGVPFAALGGIVALRARGMEFTISAAVGFIAVAGVAMLSGLVLVSTIRQGLAEGIPLPEAIEQARLRRLRAILMTALVAALGFVPMAVNTGFGAEVQRPLATVVVAGILADNLLTLLMLPAMYVLFRPRPASGGPAQGPPSPASRSA